MKDIFGVLIKTSCHEILNHHLSLISRLIFPNNWLAAQENRGRVVSDLRMANLVDQSFSNCSLFLLLIINKYFHHGMATQVIGLNPKLPILFHTITRMQHSSDQNL